MADVKKITLFGMDPLSPVANLGARTMEVLEFHGRYALFCLAITFRILTPPFRWRLFIDQCVEIGIKSLPIAALTSTFVGMVMVLQTGYQLIKFGAKNYVPGISFIANAREMVPAFCAMVVGARVAASITAELGTMRVTEQIDAMDVLNVDPVRYLCAPRVVAMTVMLPLVSCLCLITGYLGGTVVAKAGLGIDYLQYYSTTLAFARIEDVVGGLIKTIFFGALIALTGCFYGFHTEGGAAGVGRATTNSVVFAMIQILIFDYLLTSILLLVTGLSDGG